MNSIQHANGRLVAFVALGSNVGNSVELVLRAMDRLEKFSLEPTERSSLWKSSPVNCPPGSADFVNAVVLLYPTTETSPDAFLAALQAIEKEFGRKQKVVLNEPRPLDLDIVAFGNIRCDTPTLSLPHPRAHLRRFVLMPLAELDASFVLPGFADTVGAILSQLQTDEKVERIETHKRKVQSRASVNAADRAPQTKFSPRDSKSESGPNENRCP